jgi:hypothetical protein
VVDEPGVADLLHGDGHLVLVDDRLVELLTFVPSMTTEPRSGLSRPMRVFSSTDLPVPEGLRLRGHPLVDPVVEEGAQPETVG